VSSVLTELLLISPADNPSIDIIFVHGLNGSARGTWDFGDQPSWDTWIKKVHPDARIWSLAYRLRSSWWRGGSMAIQDRAVNVLATIYGDLSGETPILFVCHSYGGLLVKQMLSTGLCRAHNEYGGLAARVKAMVFLGTPHNGSRVADYVNALKSILRSSAAIAELRQNAPHLRELGGWFRNQAQSSGWKMRVFFETMNTRGVRVVDEDSADPHIVDITPIGVDADHFEICKPPKPDVRLSQTNALIEEILGASRPAQVEQRLSALATLISATDPSEFEWLRRRYEMQLKAAPGNQELIDALSNFSLSCNVPECSEPRGYNPARTRPRKLAAVIVIVLALGASAWFVSMQWSTVLSASAFILQFIHQLIGLFW
jgi:pimeloyl-ACP methyl ester carboxylesterase